MNDAPNQRGNCEHCAAPMLSHNQWWRRFDADQRAHWRHLGYRSRHKDGLCHPCWSARIKREDAHLTPVTTPYTRAELMVEWEHLVDHSLTLRENCRRIAPRLGMRVHAMEKALGRAGVRAWPVDTAAGWDEWAS